MDPVQRALDLIRLAVDRGAASEEARTAAYAACKLIWEHKLTLAVSSGAEKKKARAPAREKRRTRAEGWASAKNLDVDGACALCGYVMASQKTCWNEKLGYVHAKCNRPAF